MYIRCHSDIIFKKCTFSFDCIEENYKEVQLPALNDQTDAFEVAFQNLKELELIENDLPTVPVKSPVFRAQIATYTSEEASNMSKVGQLLNFGVKEIHRRYIYIYFSFIAFNMTDIKIAKSIYSYMNPNKHDNLKRWKLFDSSVLLDGFCYPNYTINCHQSLYRTADGTCNNKDFDKTWGSAMKPFRRILLPNYSDGL